MKLNINNIVLKEIKNRKLNFALGLLSVFFAITIIVAAINSLNIFDYNTSAIIDKKEAETKERMRILEDDYRKIMKQLGFNILILPEKQNLEELFSDDYSTEYMPEEYVDKLASSPIITIRHLLPSLFEKILWPENGHTILLTGIRAEVPLLHLEPREPILEPVPEGTMIIGYQLHKNLKLSEGQKVVLFGRKFLINKCNEERGNEDDITVWINLDEAQEILNKPGKINAILALKCFCKGNSLPEIRDEVSNILPGTQVIEKGSRVITRAEARERAAIEANQSIEAEKTNRLALRREREKFTSVLVPVIISISSLWLFIIFLTNTRNRKSEVGLLKALGVKSRKILWIFLYKAIFIGITGSITGYFFGLLFGILWANIIPFSFLFDIKMLLLVIFISPMLSMIASWLPAVISIKQDPAIVLMKE